MKNLFNVFSKKYEITRFNAFKTDFKDGGSYKEEISETSYLFLKSCCNEHCNTPNEVIEKSTADEIDSMDTSNSEIIEFTWEASLLGDITANHKLDSLKFLTIYVDSEIKVDLTGFPNLRRLRIINDMHTLAPTEYIGSSFPEIKWGNSRYKKLEILGFDIDAFNLAAIPELSDLLELSIFYTKISHLSQITFASNSRVQEVWLNGKDFDKTELTLKLEA